MPAIIDVKTAVQKALGYFEELMPTAGNTLLEEVEFVEGSHEWRITFSVPASGLAIIAGGDRNFKTIAIDAETGEFRSMKIRPLPVPA